MIMRTSRDDQRLIQDRADQSPAALAVHRDVELATARWVDWFNHRRLCSTAATSPVELEAAYYAQRRDPAAGWSQIGLRTRRAVLGQKMAHGNVGDNEIG